MIIFYFVLFKKLDIFKNIYIHLLKNAINFIHFFFFKLREKKLIFKVHIFLCQHHI